MSKVASKAANLSIATVALEDDVQNITLKVDQETPEVTALADAGPRRLVDNYDYSLSIDGAADFASGQSDATLFGLVGDSDGGAMAFDPTGESADPNNPNYDATAVVLGSYQIKASRKAAVTFSAELRGSSALTRAVA